MSSQILRHVISLSIVAFGALGCSMSTSQFVPFPDQANKVDDPEKARIYLMHLTDQWAIPIDKMFDGEILIGTTMPYGYLCWEREPGRMQLVTKRTGNTFALPMNVEKAMAYYVAFQAEENEPSLKLLQQEYGRERLRECKVPRVKVTPGVGPRK